MDKEIRTDAKLKRLPARVLEELWRFRNPEEDGQALTYVEILAELKGRGIESSLGALSEFYSWLRLKRRIDHATERAMQSRMELAKDSSVTPEDLERVAQCVFTAETIEGGDVKAFVALATLRLKQKQVMLDERRLKMLEAKAARYDEIEAKAREIKAGGGLSDETLDMLEKQLKLL